MAKNRRDISAEHATTASELTTGHSGASLDLEAARKVLRATEDRWAKEEISSPTGGQARAQTPHESKSLRANAGKVRFHIHICVGSP